MTSFFFLRKISKSQRLCQGISFDDCKAKLFWPLRGSSFWPFHCANVLATFYKLNFVEGNICITSHVAFADACGFSTEEYKLITSFWTILPKAIDTIRFEGQCVGDLWLFCRWKRRANTRHYITLLKSCVASKDVPRLNFRPVHG